MTTTDLILVAFATSGLSVTLAKAKVMEPTRKWLKKTNKWLGYMAECPYCLSHWIALAFWAQFTDINIVLFVFADVAAAALITGAIMRMLLWHEAEVEALNQDILELKEILRELANETDRESDPADHG